MNKELVKDFLELTKLVDDLSVVDKLYLSHYLLTSFLEQVNTDYQNYLKSTENENKSE